MRVCITARPCGYWSVAVEVIAWVIAAPFLLLGAIRIVWWIFACIGFWVRTIHWLRGSGDRPHVLDWSRSSPLDPDG
jgi:hypothetical protein